jgi:hypothetical protein
MNSEQQIDRSRADSATMTAREALDHSATRASIAFWQRYRKRGDDDTSGLPMFDRVMQYCMGESHHIGYVREKWSIWSEEPLWFSRRDFRQWPRYITWVIAWSQDAPLLPDGGDY